MRGVASKRSSSSTSAYEARACPRVPISQTKNEMASTACPRRSVRCRAALAGPLRNDSGGGASPRSVRGVISGLAPPPAGDLDRQMPSTAGATPFRGERVRCRASRTLAGPLDKTTARQSEVALDSDTEPGRRPPPSRIGSSDGRLLQFTACPRRKCGPRSRDLYTTDSGVGASPRSVRGVFSGLAHPPLEI